MTKDLGPAAVEEELRTRLTGRTFEVTGNALKDEFGLMLIVQGIKPVTTDVKGRAHALVERVQKGVA